MCNHDYILERVEDIKKVVIAAANSAGGLIYVGIRNDGTVAGVEDSDSVMVQIANSLKDSISPDVLPFVNLDVSDMEGKKVILINVSTGTNRPYYLRDKGLKPSGVYVRKGSSCQPLSEEGIREMILENSGRSYEELRCMDQNLTFNTFECEMQKRSLDCNPLKFMSLKMTGVDGLYTNLAMLLSDQCEATTKVALFQGKDKEVFRDCKEFSGSLLKQLEDVYSFIDLCNKTRATFKGLERTDKRDYPEEALREALLNSFVHRDYSFSGSNIINIYEDRIEFVSVGGLVSGLELNSIFLGISQSRNPNLASIFYRMKLIESYGTGIGKIEKAYKTEICKPVFETAKGVFRVTLPNRNEIQMEGQTVIEKTSDEEKELVVAFAEENGSVTRKQVEQLTGSGTTKACRILKDLCISGKLEHKGNGKLSTYVRKDA